MSALHHLQLYGLFGLSPWTGKQGRQAERRVLHVLNVDVIG
jgi:hypothetical protein